MNCTVCGGTLKYINGIYVCDNCGTKQQMTNFFENTEVFIAYVETDEYGRRTKDSVIMQEIYNKLQGAKINTFYQRVSVADMFGDEADKARHIAISKAKVVIIGATSRENFIKQLDQYNETLVDKKVIPVYTGVNINDIPGELSKLQAVNYDNIGAETDLLNNILRFLGKNTEANVVGIASERMRKKRNHLAISMCCVLMALILALIYVMFGTPYILKSRKYAYAQSLLKQENYVEAIGVYSAIEDYKNTKDMLNAIYNKYEGYYANDEVSLGVSIDKNYVANLELIFNINKEKNLKFESETKVVGNQILFYFENPQQSRGNGKIILDNQGLNLKINNPEEETNIPDIDCFFELSEKSDTPLLNQISKTTVLEWLNEELTINDLIVRGYEITQLERIGHIEETFLYQLDNTNIKFSTWSDAIAIIIAPAKFILPDKIGESENFIKEGDVLYLPNGEPLESCMQINPYKTPIEENTDVLIVSKTMYEYASGEYGRTWEEFLNYLTGVKKPNETIDNDIKDSEPLYRVRKSANDAVSQKGAYRNLQKAMREADIHKGEGYGVYDESGKLIYKP